MEAVAMIGNDTIHFTGSTESRTLCGRVVSYLSWQEVQRHEVEDALAGCLCRGCMRTQEWKRNPALVSDDPAMD